MVLPNIFCCLRLQLRRVLPGQNPPPLRALRDDDGRTVSVTRQLLAAINIYREVVARVSREDRVA
jgi:hypothetical protein